MIQESEQAKFSLKRYSKTNNKSDQETEEDAKNKQAEIFLGQQPSLEQSQVRKHQAPQKGLGVGVKAINSDIGKKLVDEGIKHAPELYRLGRSKISNKNVKRALESEVTNYIVKEAQKKSTRKLVQLK